MSPPYIRPEIAALEAYLPGEQRTDDRIIKLNTNENPYPPGEAVLAALSSVTSEDLRRYPPPLATPLRACIAAHHGVAVEQVIATNGGDELLRLAITACVPPGGRIGLATPSYSLYPVLAQIQGADVIAVPLEQNWQPPSDLAQRFNAAGVQLVLMVNPHAPSGTLVGETVLAGLADELDGALLIDQAYIDFVDPDLGADSCALLSDHDNVLLLRTLSKGYSLAGLRCGYGLGHPAMIAALDKVRDSYNMDAITQRLAVAALQDQPGARQSWQAVRRERQRLAEALAGLRLESAPSQSNFLLATIPPTAPLPARDLQQALAARHILVRWFDDPRLRDKLRITVGTPRQNDLLLATLAELLHTTLPG